MTESEKKETMIRSLTSINLINQGLLDPPYLFQTCPSADGTMDATPKSFLLMIDRLPSEDVLWTALRVGHCEFPMVTMDVLNGDMPA